MKKFIPWIVVLAVVALIGVWFVGDYNEMVTKGESRGDRLGRCTNLLPTACRSDS